MICRQMLRKNLEGATIWTVSPGQPRMRLLDEG
jgi:hypothetical protein